MFSKKIFNLTNLTLVTALTLSIIAAWYSILGLVAIFAAAVIPIIIMGTALEVSKVVTTVWLHAYWDRVKWSMRLYLVFAVISLAFLTSMGIFGFLSKAHSDQSLVSGDVQAKIALYDEKIRIAKENIDANRRALKQMDEAVDQVMGRSTTEQGAERSVQIRRQQSPERQRLIREIETEQKKISSLNEERAPIAAEVRKVEAEVGPIKYIAALIYGDNPEANLLERAVRWVIILIVFVFDPLALTLVLAANESRRWDKEKLSEKRHTLVEEKDNTLEVDKFIEPIDSQPIEEPYVTYPVQEKTEEIVKEEQVQPTLYRKKWVDKVPGIRVPHQVYKPVVPPKPEPETLKCVKCGSTLEFIKGFGNFCVNNECDLTNLPEEPKEVQIVEVANNFEIKTENVTKVLPWKESEGGYVVYDGKSMKKDVFQSLHPEMFRLTADRDIKITTNFGVEFPKVAFKGDVFVRVDALPNKVFKFDGIKWIEISKQNNDSYIQDEEYVKYLIQKISSGELDVEMLTEKEKLFLENYLSQKP